jgi:hypothetical protein
MTHKRGWRGVFHSLTGLFQVWKRKPLNVAISRSNATLFAIPPEICASAHPEGLILLNTKEGMVFSANRTGCVVWEGLVRGRSLDAMAAELRLTYGISQTEARENAADFVSELENQRLIIRAE